MDKEQINELKPGDEVLIRCRFEKIKENGDFSLSYLLTTVHGKLYMYKAAVHPSAVIIKSPTKHDPCRFFRKGDRVRIKREVNGRKLNHVFVNFGYDQTYTVAQDEEQKEHQSGRVKLINETGFIFTGSFYELELVTPVEELEPYSVKDDGGFYYIEKQDELHALCTFNKTSHPNAKAAAEAECDRLNAEHRKEAANG